jgi:Holliday junction resolvase-like predicted endonuclease
MEVVMVEVKARQHEEFGAAIEAVGPRKAGRLRAAALWWLSDRGLFPCLVRFDVILVAIDARGVPLKLEHIRDVLGGARS